MILQYKWTKTVSRLRPFFFITPFYYTHYPPLIIGREIVRHHYAINNVWRVLFTPLLRGGSFLVLIDHGQYFILFSKYGTDFARTLLACNADDQYGCTSVGKFTKPMRIGGLQKNCAALQPSRNWEQCGWNYTLLPRLRLVRWMLRCSGRVQGAGWFLHPGSKSRT